MDSIVEIHDKNTEIKLYRETIIILVLLWYEQAKNTPMSVT